MTIQKEPDKWENDLKDEVGGVHGGGVGWNPNGVFCGECGSVTCAGCPQNGCT